MEETKQLEPSTALARGGEDRDTAAQIFTAHYAECDQCRGKNGRFGLCPVGQDLLDKVDAEL